MATILEQQIKAAWYQVTVGDKNDSTLRRAYGVKLP